VRCLFRELVSGSLAFERQAAQAVTVDDRKPERQLVNGLLPGIGRFICRQKVEAIATIGIVGNGLQNNEREWCEAC